VSTRHLTPLFPPTVLIISGGAVANSFFDILPYMDVLALSHLRWNFVFQRPQHLLSRCAQDHRVFYWEEPLFFDSIEPRLNTSVSGEGVMIVVPELPSGMSEAESFAMQQRLLSVFVTENGISAPLLWFYTPMALNFTGEQPAAAVVYDCMDELSAFRGAPPGLRAAERRLFEQADLVFTGGRSLYEVKRNSHPSVHLFPSSIDVQHFHQARTSQAEPPDQVVINHPRIGFSGVIDERMDLSLLDEIARMRPDWQFVLLGPVVKINEADLPRRANLHFLGAKPYRDLPQYLAGWDLAMLPFARNESTRFISPTKTPEYLAAGLPTISTAIVDVVRPYGELGLVSIANNAEEFLGACEALLAWSQPEREHWQTRVDDFIRHSSWDQIWSQMWELIETVVSRRLQAATAAD
jgi:glycosyltransferase involved in cell wall biosynthesis